MTAKNAKNIFKKYIEAIAAMLKFIISCTENHFRKEAGDIMKAYGYIRVSSADQNEDRQMIAMNEQNIAAENLFVDKQSGKDFKRPAYQKMVGGMKSGDLLYVTSIDRLLQAPRHDGEIRRLRWLRRSDQDDHARHLKRVCGVTFRGMAAKQCIFTAGSSPESEKAHFGLFHFVRNASSLCAASFFAKHGDIYRVS